jgi:NADH-quinone oxidoreductase subunit L
VGAAFFDWVFLHEPEAVELVPWVAALSIVIAIVGVGAGYLVYRRWKEPDPVHALGPVSRVLEHKYYLDDLYWRGIVRPIRDPVAAFVYWTNQNVIDRAVNGTATLAVGFSRAISWFDRTVIDGAVNGVAHIAGFTGGILRYIQSGNVQLYAAFLFAGVVILAVVITRI